MPAVGSFCQCEILLIGAPMRWEGGRNESILVGVLESSDYFLVRGRLTHSAGIERTLDLYRNYIHYIKLDLFIFFSQQKNIFLNEIN